MRGNFHVLIGSLAARGHCRNTSVKMSSLNEVYTAEKIVDERVYLTSGERDYCIKWVEDETYTWECEQDVEHLRKTVADWETAKQLVQLGQPRGNNDSRYSSTNAKSCGNNLKRKRTEMETSAAAVEGTDVSTTKIDMATLKVELTDDAHANEQEDFCKMLRNKLEDCANSVLKDVASYQKCLVDKSKEIVFSQQAEFQEKLKEQEERSLIKFRHLKSQQDNERKENLERIKLMKSRYDRKMKIMEEEKERAVTECRKVVQLLDSTKDIFNSITECDERSNFEDLLAKAQEKIVELTFKGKRYDEITNICHPN